MIDEVLAVAEATEAKPVESKQAEAKSSTPAADPVAVWIGGLSARDRKASVKACLDEYEACADQVRQRGRKITPEALKACKAWGEHQKRLLRLLGHKHRMSIIGGVRFDIEEDGIFSDDKKIPLDDRPPSVAQ